MYDVIFTSLIASANRNELEPWRYLRDLLCLLPTWPAHRVLELAPPSGPRPPSGTR